MKTIKSVLIVFQLIVLVLFSSAQENWVSYSHTIPLEGYDGYQFRIQAAIKTEIADDSTAARLITRIDTKLGRGFWESMWNNPVRKNDWATYTIKGIVDTGAYQILFGPLCTYNGKFFYDDIRVDVRTDKNEWKNIYHENFEDGRITFKQGHHDYDAYGQNEKFQAQIVKSKEPKRNNYLLITGSEVPNYGMNKSVGKYANVNGIQLYYEVYGEGHPFVILHGNGGSIMACTSFMPHLVSKYKVIAIDSRAQGRSTDNEAPLTYMQMASDVKVLLDQLQIDSVYVWGHSDGAILSLILAMEYPKKVKRILAFAPNITPDSSAVYQCAIDDSKRIITKSGVALKRKLNQLMLDYPNIPFSSLSAIKAPVLLMVGDRDIIRHEHSLRIFQNIPNSHLCILPGTTHNAKWEKKDLFLRLMDDFFEKPFTMPDSKDWFQ